MTATTITAAGASDAVSIVNGDDGTLVIKTGPTGAKVNALSVASNGAVAVTGTPTNDSAAAGQVGEYMENIRLYASPLALNNTLFQPVCTITLTPGDWDVSGVVHFSLAGTAGSYVGAGLSTSSTAVGNEDYTQLVQTIPVGTNVAYIQTHTKRFNVSVSTPIYLNSFATVPSSGSAFGNLRARRIR